MTGDSSRERAGAEHSGGIDFEHFQAVDMRVGTITAVDELPEARKPAWKLTIVGPFVSEVLVLGALDDAKGVVLLRPDADVEPGDRIG